MASRRRAQRAITEWIARWKGHPWLRGRTHRSGGTACCPMSLRDVERLDGARECEPGVIAAFDRIDAAAAGDDAESVARRWEVAESRPAALVRLIELDLADRAGGLLATGDDDASTYRRSADSPTRFVHRRQRPPPLCARVVGLDDVVVAV